jgi:hypothetical protein
MKVTTLLNEYDVQVVVGKRVRLACGEQRIVFKRGDKAKATAFSSDQEITRIGKDSITVGETKLTYEQFAWRNL